METFLSLTSAIAAVAAAAVSIIVYRDNKSPDIIAYLTFDNDHHILSFFIENRGNGVARNVQIKNFDTSLIAKESKEYLDSSFVKRGISMLVPGDNRNTIVNHSKMNYSENSVNDIIVEYEYRGLFRWLGAKRTFTLDYCSFNGSLFVQSDLREIRSSLKRIDDSCKKLANSRR